MLVCCACVPALTRPLHVRILITARHARCHRSRCAARGRGECWAQRVCGLCISRPIDTRVAPVTVAYKLGRVRCGRNTTFFFGISLN